MYGSGYEERIPLILVLDCSASMGRPESRPRIGQLVGTVASLLRTMREEPALRSRVDVAVVTFGSTVQVRTDLRPDQPSGGAFVPVYAVRMPELVAGGHSAMLPAVLKALEIGRERGTQLAGEGVPCLRPVIWLITDGAPTDADGALQDEAQCAHVAATIRAAEDARNCLFFAIGVADADQDLLRVLAPRATYFVDSLDYPEILHLITTSSQEVRSTWTAEETHDRVRELADRASRIRRLEDTI